MELKLFQSSNVTRAPHAPGGTADQAGQGVLDVGGVSLSKTHKW